MDLREFVGQSLTQIIDGIIDATAATKGKGAAINPKLLQNLNLTGTGLSPHKLDLQHLTTAGLLADKSGEKAVAIVEFDLAVTVEASSKKANEKGGGGSIGAKLAVFSASLKGDAKASSEENLVKSNVSRIKFRLPVRFPNPS